MTYARPIKAPTTQREGLCNFVQMIINDLESGAHREALLKAVDLLEDLRCGTYASETMDGKTALTGLKTAHAIDLTEQVGKAQVAGYDAGYALGVATERARVANLLGLAP